MRRLLVDTGVLYALTDPSDQYHKRAQQEALTIELEGWQIFLTPPVMLEAHALVLKKLGHKVARRWLAEVRVGTGPLSVLAEDYDVAVDLVAKFNDQKITLFDATLAALSMRLDLPVWTYDRDFDILGIQVWRPLDTL